VARFSLYCDTDLHGPVVDAFIASKRDVLRGIDAYPEATVDEVHFARAAQEGRVFLTNDRRILKNVAEKWVKQGRPFRMITWPRSHYRRMSPGDFVRALEELEGIDEPFPAEYPIVHLSLLSR
jgi:hypothetical protein